MARRRRRKRSRSGSAEPVATPSTPSGHTRHRQELQQIRERMTEMVLRHALEQLSAGSYKGAKRTRLTSDWISDGGSPDENLLEDLPTLRERSRELERNDGLAKSVFDAYASNVIGRGLTLQMQVRHDKLGISETEAKKYADDIEDSFAAWCRHADAHGRATFAGMQALVLRGMKLNGDIFSVPVMIDEPWREAELAIELIEADRVSDPEGFGGWHGGNPRIRGGVEIDENNRPIAYHVRQGHPGDSREWNKANQWVRVRARLANGRPSMLHHFVPTRPGQSRGVPLLASVLNEFHDRRSYLEAERVAARAAAAICMIIETIDPAGAMADAVSKGGLVEELEPGIMQYLSPGEKMQSFVPNRPNSAFAAFLETLDRGIGCGANLSYGSLTKNTSKSNFSNMRTELIADRRVFRMDQQLIIDSFTQPYLELFIEEKFLRGELKAIPSLDHFEEHRREWTRAEWIPDGWDWIDPSKEVQAAKTAIEARIESRTRVIKSRGIDPQRVFQDLENESQQASPGDSETPEPEDDEEERELVTVPAAEEDDDDSDTDDPTEE